MSEGTCQACTKNNNHIPCAAHDRNTRSYRWGCLDVRNSRGNVYHRQTSGMDWCECVSLRLQPDFCKFVKGGIRVDYGTVAEFWMGFFGSFKIV